MEYPAAASEQDRRRAQDHDVSRQTIRALSLLPSDGLPTLEGAIAAKDWDSIFWMEQHWAIFSQSGLFEDFAWRPRPYAK
jgi:hypothetical protein